MCRRRPVAAFSLALTLAFAIPFSIGLGVVLFFHPLVFRLVLALALAFARTAVFVIGVVISVCCRLVQVLGAGILRQDFVGHRMRFRVLATTLLTGETLAHPQPNASL